MSKKSIIIRLAAFTAAVAVVAAAGTAVVAGNHGNKPDYTKMSPEELADYMIFEAGGFKVDAKTQEGGTVRDRLTQDEIQAACSALQERSIDGATAAKVTKAARESIELPEGGIKLGDWVAGSAVARSGYGFRVGHRSDNHSGRDPGGNCYACHQMDPEEITYGTLGPSLAGYGKVRGTSDAILKYTYEIVYNAHAYFPCTAMPRFGENGVLTDKQIADVMAYLLDPESPVNK